MKCPTCAAWTSVEQTKDLGDFVERRRRCANNHPFTTEERVTPAKKRGRPVKTKEVTHVQESKAP